MLPSGRRIRADRTCHSSGTVQSRTWVPEDFVDLERQALAEHGQSRSDSGAGEASWQREQPSDEFVQAQALIGADLIQHVLTLERCLLRR